MQSMNMEEDDEEENTKEAEYRCGKKRAGKNAEALQTI